MVHTYLGVTEQGAWKTKTGACSLHYNGNKRKAEGERRKWWQRTSTERIEGKFLLCSKTIHNRWWMDSRKYDRLYCIYDSYLSLFHQKLLLWQKERIALTNPPGQFLKQNVNMISEQSIASVNDLLAVVVRVYIYMYAWVWTKCTNVCVVSVTICVHISAWVCDYMYQSISFIHNLFHSFIQI